MEDLLKIPLSIGLGVLAGSTFIFSYLGDWMSNLSPGAQLVVLCFVVVVIYTGLGPLKEIR